MARVLTRYLTMSNYTNRKPFYRTKTDEERALMPSKVYTIRLNSAERGQIGECMKLLRQTKHSTTMKQLMRLGIVAVLQDEKTRAVLGIVSNNARKNETRGIVDPELEMKPL